MPLAAPLPVQEWRTIRVPASQTRCRGSPFSASARLNSTTKFASQEFELLGSGSVLLLFIAGVIARGRMGSVGKIEHGPLFYAALILHVLSGGIFLLLAGFLVLPSGIGNYLINPEDWLARKHRNFGNWAVRAITILCLVVM